jgi:uncharacterized membrane protein
MKKIIVFCLILFLLCISVVEAKSYSYDYINISLDFSPNGNVLVKQERTYNFQGSFSWAYLDLKKQGATNIKFIELKDLDSGQVLSPVLSDTPDNLKVTWYYSANNEVKKFLITYEIDGTVKSYQDVAEFYWKVIEDEHEFIKSFHGEVNLPQSSPNLFKVFIHTAAQPGTLNFSEDLKKAFVEVKNVPKDSFVEFRVLTSPSIFPEVSPIPEKKYESILNEEKAIFQPTEPNKIPVNNSYSLTYSPILFFVLIIIPIIVFFYFYSKYGVEPKVNYKLTYEQEPPRDIPPMVVATFYGTDLKTSAKGLLATIFDLSRRGYIDIREEKKKQLFGLTEKTEQIFKITKKRRKALSPKSSLLGFERDVLSLLFKEMSKNKDEISSSEMTKWCKWHSRTIQENISTLSKDAKKWFEKKYFKFYEPKSLKEASKFLIFLILYCISVFAVVFYFNIIISFGFSLIFLVIIIAALIGFSFIAMNAIKRKTPEATLEIKKWNAFKRYISDFSAMKDAPTTLLHIWDRYLVYAVVLGVAEKLLENIKNLSLERHAAVAAVAWYHPIGTPGIPTGMMSPESFTAFSSNMTNMINALSSSSSVGGGFSGGGGGGGGGGGSGAG